MSNNVRHLLVRYGQWLLQARTESQVHLQIRWSEAKMTMQTCVDLLYFHFHCLYLPASLLWTPVSILHPLCMAPCSKPKETGKKMEVTFNLCSLWKRAAANEHSHPALLFCFLLLLLLLLLLLFFFCFFFFMGVSNGWAAREIWKK